MIVITDMMVERVKDAITRIDEANKSVEVPNMGNVFVTAAETELPLNSKKIVELGIDNRLYLVYTIIGDDV